METMMGARWATPAAGFLLGVAMFLASTVGDQPVLGLAMLAVMAIYSGVLLFFSGRSETIGVLAGRPIDERLAAFNMRATAVAGIAAIVVAISGFLWALAHGQSGSDFAIVAAVAGIAYIGALIWNRWRG